MMTSEVKIVEENGIQYEVETVYAILENGEKKFHHESKLMITEPKSYGIALTEQEEIILNTAINTEYLVCLAELGL